MNEVIKDAVLDESVAEIRAILAENMNSINEAMVTALAEFAGEKEFVFPVSLKLKISPRGRGAKVSAKISYSVKYSDETEGRVIDPDQLEMDLC